MNAQHICATTAHLHYCERHGIDYYPSTCGCGTGCPECDLERAVKAARAVLPEAVNGRLERAVELVQAGYVYVVNGRAAVKSQSSERIYEVNGAGCFCEDACYRAPTVAGKLACEHQIAVWLRRRMDRPVMLPPTGPVRSRRQTTNTADCTTVSS